MASTVLVKDVLWRVAILLQDTVPQFQRQPETELVRWLDDAQMAIVKFMPALCSRIDSVLLQPGTRQSIAAIPTTSVIPGDGSTPGATVYGTQLLDVLRNMGANGTTPGNAIRNVKREILDSQNPGWHTATGPAVSSFMYDPRTPLYYYVTPAVPPATAEWIEISYAAQPTKIPNTGTPGAPLYGITGTSTLTLTLGDEHVDDLTNYLVARANMKEVEWADGNKATTFSQMFLTSLNAKVTALTGVNPNLEQLPFAEPIGRAK